MCSMIAKRLCHHSGSGISYVTIFGGGLMGSGIAQVAAQSGFNVLLVDQKSEILSSAHSIIAKSLGKVAKKQDKLEPKAFVDSVLSRIGTKAFDSMAINSFEVDPRTDLVVEAIVENMEAKHKLFDMLDKLAPDKTIFATNTSSLPVGEIFKHVKRQDKVAGLHYFNPVPIMKLLEVVKAKSTSEETFGTLCHFGAEMNKTVIRCKDTPGFIVNRLLVPYLMEAVRMLERGDAEMKDIDTGMRLGAGHPMGPFELSDYVGLDTLLFILQDWSKRYPDNPSFHIPQTLQQLVSEGKLGRKSGQGFYNYTK